VIIETVIRNMRLTSDQDLDVQALVNSTTSSPQSIERLRRKIQETERLQIALQAEAARNEALLSELRPLLSQSSSAAAELNSRIDTETTVRQQPSFSFLTSDPTASSFGVAPPSKSRPLTQNTQFTLSQLPALKSLLTSLPTYLGSLPEAEGNVSEVARVAYIESQSRRAMARKGLDPDTKGGAGTESLGRPLGNEELRALEGIADGLSNGGQNGHGDYDEMEE